MTSNTLDCRVDASRWRQWSEKLSPEQPEPVNVRNGEHETKTARRLETEGRLLQSALRILQRDGVLAGLNLADVAEEAGVNRGLIYMYFGSRQELIRAAIKNTRWEASARRPLQRFDTLPFAERRIAVFEDSLLESQRAKLLALLVLDGDVSAKVFPQLNEARARLQEDVDAELFDPDVDPVVAHMMTGVLYLGYGLFREQLAAEAETPLSDLDDKATLIAERMIRGIVNCCPINHTSPG